MAIQDDNTILMKSDLKAYHEAIAPMLGGSFMMSTNVSDYYSIDEKIVGVWTDGKPIYQKTFTYSSATVESTPQFYIVANISSYNIDKIINCFGNMQWGVDGPYYSLPFTLSTNYIISVDAYLDSSAPNLILRTYRTNGTTTISDITITLQYTKTTDVANSAVITPGAYDINFPNTWPENKEIFFGNGLYGIRATGRITSSGNTVIANASNVSRIINNGGCGITTWKVAIGSWFNSNNYSSNVCYNPTGTLEVNFGSEYVGASYDIWVTYTK